MGRLWINIECCLRLVPSVMQDAAKPAKHQISAAEQDRIEARAREQSIQAFRASQDRIKELAMSGIQVSQAISSLIFSFSAFSFLGAVLHSATLITCISLDFSLVAASDLRPFAKGSHADATRYVHWCKFEQQNLLWPHPQRLLPLFMNFHWIRNMGVLIAGLRLRSLLQAQHGPFADIPEADIPRGVPGGKLGIHDDGDEDFDNFVWYVKRLWSGFARDFHQDFNADLI